MRSSVALLLLGLVAGCGIEVDYANTEFRCTAGECPTGFDCMAGMCVDTDSGRDDDGSDASGPESMDTPTCSSGQIASQVVDGFGDGNPAPIWSATKSAPAITADESEGHALFIIPDGQPGSASFRSACTYSLVNEGVSVRLHELVNSTPGGEVYLQAIFGQGQQAKMLHRPGKLVFVLVVDGVSVTSEKVYSADQDQVWRIDALVGSVRFQTSPDGVDFTMQKQLGVQLPLDDVTVEFGVRGPGTDVVRARFDDYNGGPP